ncbi:DinB family protein [Catalinimonas sp. 4WD22]|uniref:DinB family protein n=1 Tax=Catalinimonas locisalis TaxID=3133978 RepID=UPI003101330E
MDGYIKELFAYNHYANQLFIRSFEDGFDVEKGIKLFSHIINAHHIWLARIREEKPVFGVWEIHISNSFTKVDEQNYSQSLQLLEKESDLDTIISYSNSKGKAHRNSVREILLHIVNHSTYHRGQLASLIRESGMEPPVSDYIFYKRDQI